jgi:DNA repair exonuclease SbcCD ATPase subunit
MLLSYAIKKNAAALADAQTAYKQNVVTVNNLLTSVLNSSLPTPTELPVIPPDYADYATALEGAQQCAYDWVNTVMARLLSVPAEVQDYNTVINALLQDAQSQLSILVSSPADQTALDLLTKDLKNLSTQLNMVTVFISSAITSIQKVNDQLPTAAANLQSIADKSLHDAAIDQADLDKLNTEIANLKDEISTLSAQIAEFAFVDAAAITLGLVASIAAWPVGLTSWIVLGPVVAVATTYIALDSVKLVNDKNLLQADQDRASDLYNSEVVLNSLAANFSSLASQTTAIEANLQSILNEWQTLENEVNSAISDINKATQDTTSANYIAVMNDINDAITEWNLAYAQAGILNITLNVNTAPLKVGMSPSEVQAALAQGKTMDIMTFYNSIAS